MWVFFYIFESVKQSYRFILSSVLLLTMIGQLIVFSSSVLFSDESQEETIELKAEDIFDDEMEDQNFESYDWLKTNSIVCGSFEIFSKASRCILGGYTAVNQSIPVPPPEFV
jgi:hypothetical protein